MAFLISQVSRSFTLHFQMFFYLLPPEECGLPTPAITELTDAQRHCVESIYTDFLPYPLINVSSILSNLFMPFSLRLFALNTNLIDVSYNSYTKFYENLENRHF